MPIRRRAWLTLEGWYYLAVLAFIIGGAVLRSVNLLVVLAGTMIAPPLFNWRLVMASLRGLTLHRQLPHQAIAGHAFTVELELQNSRSWLSSWLVTIDDWLTREAHDPPPPAAPPNPPTDSARSPSSLFRLPLAARNFLRSVLRSRSRYTKATALIPHAPARGTARGSYRLTLHRRGRYRFGPLRISTRFPLGLVLGQITLPAPATLLVAPRIGRLLGGWGNLLEADLAGDERRHPQRGVSEGDYYGLRPWQSGDSLRWVHWRTTAKLARPMVRQYERRKSRDVAIVVDPWLPEPGERPETLVELAISIAATAITDIASRGHSCLTIAVAGHSPHCYTGPASSAFCQELLSHLALLVPGCSGNLAVALNQAQASAPRGARFIVISPRPANDPTLIAAKTELAIDPHDLVWIDAGSSDLSALFSLETSR